MSNIERMTVTMPAEMAATLRQTVAGGEYASTSEVVREALRESVRSRDQDQRDLQTLRQAIREGDESGDGIPAAEVFTELRKIIADRRKGYARFVRFCNIAAVTLWLNSCVSRTQPKTMKSKPMAFRAVTLSKMKTDFPTSASSRIMLFTTPEAVLLNVICRSFGSVPVPKLY